MALREILSSSLLSSVASCYQHLYKKGSEEVLVPDFFLFGLFKAKTIIESNLPFHERTVFSCDRCDAWRRVACEWIPTSVVQW